MTNMNVLGQVRVAVSKGNRLATLIGFILGGLAPALSFFVGHWEIDASKPLAWQVTTYIVLGGMLFSAKTVFDWARLAFGNVPKAAGFVVLVEGTMIFSQLFPLACVALATLIVINGLATSCNLVIGWREEESRKPKAARKVVTKAIPISKGAAA